MFLGMSGKGGGGEDTVAGHLDQLVLQLLRILGLQKHKSGWGWRYPGHGILTPHPVFLTDYASSYQDRLENENI